MRKSSSMLKNHRCNAQKPSLQIWLGHWSKRHMSKPFSTTFILFSSAPLLPSVPNPAQEETASRDKQGNGRRCDIIVHVDVLRYKREKRRDLKPRPADRSCFAPPRTAYFLLFWLAEQRQNLSVKNRIAIDIDISFQP